ncbi:GDP-D-glucose phosphorylase 1 [Anopheles nili]|uniref:GDP-D-glucose phosphorylase 1 n=1 Tax=Anopheles nili TaxID=185578 RepID=UPI00237C4A24|nr:GDP-D-glucose phosphorylase 1 [Anopheles nili]
MACQSSSRAAQSNIKLQSQLEKTWKKLHDAGTGFRYSLHIERERLIKGQFDFLLQLNRQRLTKRRQPQNFQLEAQFDSTKFNFNQVDSSEILFELAFPTSTSILINNSPVTLYHSLVVPEREDQRPQLLTPSGIRVAFELLLRIPDRRYRVGYNSPGALASVNHLHLHLLPIHRDLYVQHTELLPVAGVPLLYRLPDEVPAQGYCLTMHDPTRDLEPVCDGLYTLLKTLLKYRMAHNIFFTWTHIDKSVNRGAIRVIVYPRVSQCTNKTACSFNVAFLELSGFISVGTTYDFDYLTQDTIIQALREAQGDVYSALQNDFPNNSHS